MKYECGNSRSFIQRLMRRAYCMYINVCSSDSAAIQYYGNSWSMRRICCISYTVTEGIVQIHIQIMKESTLVRFKRLA